MTKKLHIYAQDINHSEAYIVGTPEALLQLAMKIIYSLPEHPLKTYEYDIKEPFFVRDGEGYEVKVKACAEEEINKLAYPYTNLAAMGFIANHGEHPYTLFKKEK